MLIIFLASLSDPLKTYLEIDVDVGSSKVGGGILGMVKGSAKALTIDLSFLLEGHQEDELPERLIGGCRIHKPDLNNLEKWGSSSFQKGVSGQTGSQIAATEAHVLLA